ncbi:hypothetical protein [Spirochaeta cellobiosiphila]|uniref:hypothetical protein n=1 Tax=Spirochaeta cellobiosiphila TaxID=504483 RepID=UPI0004064F2A|nr:hypothetical protein [Spirochaeta cellobiosiphila]
MKVAVVYFADKKRKKLADLAKGLAKGLEKQGHLVDIIDVAKDVNSKLTIYSYIAIGTESTQLFKGKISDPLKNFLRGCGMLGGKKSFAFVDSTIIGSGKTLANLMKLMESEGMFLKYSEVIKDGNEAEALGTKLKVQ